MQLHIHARDFARTSILSLGYNLSERSNPGDLRRLIGQLRPEDCGYELIRIGAPADGGYLIPNDLNGIEYCFSPGVSTISTFENHLADWNIKSFLADYSIECPPIIRPEFVFDKKFLGCGNYGNYITLSAWKEQYLPRYQGDLLLQMDIEGSEYSVIMNTPDELLEHFRIIVVEFHDLHKLFDAVTFRLFAACFEKLLQYFHVTHIHPNNIGGSVRSGDIEVPKYLEITFINNRRVRQTKRRLSFPHPLDAPNDPAYPRLDLPKCWYRSPPLGAASGATHS